LVTSFMCLFFIVLTVKSYSILSTLTFSYLKSTLISSSKSDLTSLGRISRSTMLSFLDCSFSTLKV
jgi:hypothetical protein